MHSVLDWLGGWLSVKTIVCTYPSQPIFLCCGFSNKHGLGVNLQLPLLHVLWTKQQRRRIVVSNRRRLRFYETTLRDQWTGQVLEDGNRVVSGIESRASIGRFSSCLCLSCLLHACTTLSLQLQPTFHEECIRPTTLQRFSSCVRTCRCPQRHRRLINSSARCILRTLSLVSIGFILTVRCS